MIGFHSRDRLKQRFLIRVVVTFAVAVAVDDDNFPEACLACTDQVSRQVIANVSALLGWDSERPGSLQE